MRRKIFVCVLGLTLTLSLGASAATPHPAERETMNSPAGTMEWSAIFFTHFDWMRSLFGALDNDPPPEDESETGLLEGEPSGTTETNSINPDELPTEGGGSITPDG